MRQLYQKRLSQHQKKMMRYLKYVMNDHFVLVSFFLLGALAMGYNEQLKRLSGEEFWLLPLLALIWWFSLFVGQLVTLWVPADQLFLLPKESQIKDYMVTAIPYSFIFPAVWLALITGISMPVIVLMNHHSFLYFFIYLFMLLLLKWAHLYWQVQRLFQNNEKLCRDLYTFWFLGSLLAIGLMLYGHYWTSGLLVIMLLWTQRLMALRSFDQSFLNWEEAIRLEQSRLRRWYQFFNLFTDVPEIDVQIKRRRWLDPILTFVPKEHTSTYSYLYLRSFLRGTEFSGLYVRLGILGVIILLFIDQVWLSLALTLLFIYLIGIQLIPLYQRFDETTLAAFYPIPPSQKQKGLLKVLRLLLYSILVLFFIAVSYALWSIKDIGIVVILSILFTEWLLRFYAPKRMKKMSTMIYE